MLLELINQRYLLRYSCESTVLFNRNRLFGGKTCDYTGKLLHTSRSHVLEVKSMYYRRYFI